MRRTALRLAAALALVVAFQIGGLARAVSDAVELVTTGAVHHREGCPDDENGRDCPPDCPTCHCLHCLSGGAGLAPQALHAPADPAFAGPEVGLLLYDARTPRPAEPRGIYRPPRSA
ncbi:MAG: hypothetical protein IT373_37970 [Polyangiaceae bacterium]|nr:hypothetical protein [Polyangiaceae bacterium]